MGIQAKLIIGGIIGVLIVGLLWLVYHENKTITQQAVTNGKQTVVINNQHDTITKQASGAQIADTTVATASSEVQASRQEQRAISDDTASAVQAVVQQYQQKPKPASPQAQASQDTEQEAAVSRIQVTSLWQSYCEAKPNDAQCASISKAP